MALQSNKNERVYIAKRLKTRKVGAETRHKKTRTAQNSTVKDYSIIVPKACALLFRNTFKHIAKSRICHNIFFINL